jgi:drug/metabolite transporter (DMT)-like permease
MFLAGIALLGVAVSWGGTWLWNSASARLPTTTAGLLINVETVSGYVYVYLARHQWPPLGQLLGFVFILAGVGLALTRRQTPGRPRQHRPPDRKPEPPDGLILVPQRDPAAGP